MTKLRLSSKNSERAVRNNSLILIILLIFFGCSSSTKPTYIKDTIDQAVQNICKKEYKLDVKTKLAGRTLWIYIPIDEMVTKTNKPEKYMERFNIEYNKTEFQDKILKLQYMIYPVSEKEKTQDYTYGKAFEKINSVWRVLRRVIFSMEHSKEGEPEFFCLVIADIKSGFVLQYTLYSLDFKKVSYEFISWGEYQHRTLQETKFAPEIIGDKEGVNVNYKEINMEDFLAKQIDHRVQLKFQKPEIGKGADIDKEIQKIVARTLTTYGFKDFEAVEFTNLFTNKRLILGKAETLASPIK